MTITRSQALVLLEPKLSNIWHEAYPHRPVEYTSFCNIRTTRKATVTDFKLADFGVAGTSEPPSGWTRFARGPKREAAQRFCW